MSPYTHLDLAAQMSDAPQGGILSRPIYNDERLRVVLFGFGAGQELSEHRAAAPAVIHILQGEAVLVMNGDVLDAKPGTWVYMPANLPHSVLAKTPLVMLLELLKAP
jgi:quercetin dioxygenase-like cupin family protein